MPNTLTREQIQFLSKYLGVIADQLQSKSRFSRRSKRERHNAPLLAEMVNLRSEFSDWIDMRDEVDEQLEMIALSYDMDKLPEQSALLDTLRNEHAGIVSEVRSAPADDPKFQEGKWKMLMLKGRALQLDRDARTAQALIVPPSPFELFDQSLAEIDVMSRFEDHPTLTTRIAETALDDEAKETRRFQIVNGHNVMCDRAKQAVDALSQDALNDLDRLEDLEKQARLKAIELKTARQPLIKGLLELVTSAARDKLGVLAQSGDKVAAREERREDRLRADAKMISAGLGALDTTIRDLRADLAAAEGFQEKRAILAEIATKEERREALATRAAQMDAYRANAPEHLDRILAAEAGRSAAAEAVNAVAPNSDDFDAQVMAWADGRDPEASPIVGLSEDDREAEIFSIRGKIENMRAGVLNSRDRLIVSVKLYPDEDDLTEISHPQSETLLAMLDMATAFADADKFAEARAMQNDVADMWIQFKQSRAIQLPDLPEGSQSPHKQIEARLKEASIDIDRLWGLGGDAEPFRAQHTEIAEALAAAAAQTPPDYRDVQVRTDTLFKELARALHDVLNAVPTTPDEIAQKEADDAAKTAAGTTASNIADSLLTLYRTEPVDEAHLYGIAPNDLLVIDRGGTKEYHRIVLRDDDTVQRQKYKDIPRDAIDALRQQMHMLEMLQSSEAAGCADSIAAATAKAEELRAQIENGADTYKQITSYLQEFDKTAKSSELKEWHMAGIEALVAEKDSFEKTYAGSLMPQEAEHRAQILLADIQALKIRAGTVSTKYYEIDAVLKKTDDLLAAKPKKGDGGLGKVLAKLLKSGLTSIPSDKFSTVAEQTEAMRLEQEITAGLATIKDLGQYGTGILGEHRTQLDALRKKLDKKSDEAVFSFTDEHTTLYSEVVAAKDAVPSQPGQDPTLYLQKIAELVAGVAAAATEKHRRKDEVEALRTEANDEITNVKTELDKAEGLSSYTEYKSIYDSLKAQYDGAVKAWRDGLGDSDAAMDAFRPMVPNAKELALEIGDLTLVRVTGDGFDLNGFEEALVNNIRKLIRAAEAAGTTAEGQASDAQRADATLMKGLRNVQARLALISNLEDVVRFPSGLHDRIAATVSPEKQPAEMAKVREIVLKEFRRMNARLSEDPSLAVYRDNPFDHGEGWPQLRANLLNAETTAIKGLNPGR